MKEIVEDLVKVIYHLNNEVRWLHSELDKDAQSEWRMISDGLSQVEDKLKSLQKIIKL